MKAQLAGCELKKKLVTLLRETDTTEDEDKLNTQKLAADLIILLLTGGERSQNVDRHPQIRDKIDFFFVTVQKKCNRKKTVRSSCA